MIETLLFKAPAEHEENRFVKSIVRPEKVKRVVDAHYCEYRNGYHAVETFDRFDLVVLQFHKAPLPKLQINEEKLQNYTGLHLLYSAQCPYNVSVLPDLQAVAK